MGIWKTTVTTVESSGVAIQAFAGAAANLGEAAAWSTRGWAISARAETTKGALEHGEDIALTMTKVEAAGPQVSALTQALLTGQTVSFAQTKPEAQIKAMK